MAAPSIPGLVGLEEVGRGGFAVVYRARQTSVDRLVAVKVDSRIVTSADEERRFLREARAAGRLSAHPNIVSVFDAAVSADGRPYIVMQYCPGGSYAERLASGPLPVDEVGRLGVALADALVAAHDLGVLHRDVKPANILVTEFGMPALADFGLAALARPVGDGHSGSLDALTPAYAPPEAFDAEPPSPAGDVYSLGATLYALLRGRPPRWPETGAPTLAEILRMHHEPLPDLPGVPPRFIEVLRRAMHPDPSRRWATATDLRSALAGLGPLPRERVAPPATPPRPMPVPPVAPIGGPGPAGPQSTGPYATGAHPTGAHPTGPYPAVPPRPPGPPGPSRPPGSPGPRGPLGPPQGRPKSRRLPIIAAILVGVLVVGVGIWWVLREPSGSGRDPSGTQAQGSDPSGAEASAEDVDATAGGDEDASDSSAGPAPEAYVGLCFSGGIVLNEVIQSTSRLDCGQPHYFESITGGPLDSDDPLGDYGDLRLDPAIQSDCTPDQASQILAGTRYAGQPIELAILPPELVPSDLGDNAYLCLVSLTDLGQTAGSIFDGAA